MMKTEVESSESKRRHAVKASETEDLEQIIYDRLGWRRYLSLLEMDRILQLKRDYPKTFYQAVDELHSGVHNVTRYLESILQKIPSEMSQNAPCELGPILRCQNCGSTFYDRASHYCGHEHLKSGERTRNERVQAITEAANKFVDPRDDERESSMRGDLQPSD